MIDDGNYDAVIVDAEDDGDAVTVEVVVAAGPRKGDVVRVRATGLDRDALDLLGVPVTLRVVDGRPSLDVEG